MKACFPTRAARLLGYRLLQEYFAIPEKFLFVDVTGLEPVWDAGYKNTCRTGLPAFRRGQRRSPAEAGDRYYAENLSLGVHTRYQSFSADG